MSSNTAELRTQTNRFMTSKHRKSYRDAFESFSRYFDVIRQSVSAVLLKVKLTYTFRSLLEQNFSHHLLGKVKI